MKACKARLIYRTLRTDREVMAELNKIIKYFERKKRREILIGTVKQIWLLIQFFYGGNFGNRIANNIL
jgi:hypothetical protein